MMKTRENYQSRESLLTTLLVSVFLLILLCLQFCLAEVIATDRSKNATTSQAQEFKLNCEPGEQRHFNYESATMVWGSTSQQVYLRAALRLSCMEPTNNDTLKYLAEVLSVSGDFGDVVSYKKQSVDQSARHKDGAANLRAEPVLEEVGEAIDRVQRSVSGWFTKTWGSVKDFFVNIFTSSEKSTVTRDDAFKDSGIDISSQCRGGKKAPNGLPIDDSVFDDLEPKYYIGASTMESFRGAPPVGYDIDTSSQDQDDDDDEANDEASVSFFDDPKPVNGQRSKRAAAQRQSKSSSGDTKRSRALSSQYDLDHERLLRLPFVFIQSRAGRVLEVRFSSEESDLSVKNFKRHLCDLFATNLDTNRSQTNEVSPIGEHTTKYIVDPTLNSSYIKQSLMKSASMAGADPTKLLVKALASHQANKATDQSPAEWNTKYNDGDNSVEGRQPAGGSLGDSSISVLRSINSTSSLQLNSRTMAPDIDQIQVRVKQVQQINEGRLVGSAGQLGMSLVQSGLHDNDNHFNGPHKRTGRSVGADNNGVDQLDDIADMLKVSTSFTVKLVPPSKLGNFNEPTTTTTGGDKLAAVVPQRTKRSSSSSSKGDSLSGYNKEEVATTAAALVAAYKDSSKDLFSAADSKKSTPDQRPVAGHSASSSDNNKNYINSSLPASAVAAAGDNNGNSNSNNNNNNKTTTSVNGGAKKAAKRSSNREPFVVKPADQQQLASLLLEWRQLESRLQMAPSNLLPESSAQDGQAQRLEILRDQIQMRLNEEFMSNQRRRRARNNNDGPQVAASVGGVDSRPQPSPNGNDLGLGLTQLILDSGVTAKRKGSVYGTIEEVLELELALDEDAREGSVSRLMRDTIRLDKLRAHCKSAVATLEEIRASGGAADRVQSRQPFGLLEDDGAEPTRLSRIVSGVQAKNRRKLDQCKQVAQLLLRVGDKQAADLVLELIDECNNRMLAVAKHEELGHGPMSRYYRSLRQQFTELMGNINKPSELLLDKLLARLHYPKLEPTEAAAKKRPVAPLDPQQEFTYVPASTNQQRRPAASEAGYNKSLLREEDTINNNEGAGSLVMTITTLAARPSIGRPKRAEIVEKLLLTLRGSSCSVFNGPDLDILESMGNFHEPLDEMVGKVVHLARRCRHQDQYLVACVHGLQGQLRHSITQRFLIEQLRSTNTSCTVKSEIVLTLIGAILIDELQQQQQSLAKLNNQIPKITAESQWPLVGLNSVDDVLVELVEDPPATSKNKSKNKYAQDRKCLKQLVGYYMSKKRAMTNDLSKPPVDVAASSSGRRASRTNQAAKRSRRAVKNDDQFWDEAQCKRWALPDSSAPATGGGFLAPPEYGGLGTDLLDEIDDNSILLALANNKPPGGGGGGSQRTGRRNQKLLERESELPAQNGTTAAAAATNGNLNNTTIPIIRRRHKCTASKSFGPKNAEATLKAEVVNDLVGARDENKFLARFRLATNFLGNRIDIGRMYLWHQKHTTRAHVNILGKSLWDTSHGCEDKAPRHLLYMPLFDFNLWLVKVSVGLRLHSEMGFFSNCDSRGAAGGSLAATSRSRLTSDTSAAAAEAAHQQQQVPTSSTGGGGQLELYPTMTVRASGEASAKFVVARAGMSLASQYGYQGSIRVSQQPESCMSIYSAHQPMNVTFSSWFQLWDSDCHYWGSRNKAEPQATKWKLLARKPSVWLEDECLIEPKKSSSSSYNSSSPPASTITRSPV